MTAFSRTLQFAAVLTALSISATALSACDDEKSATGSQGGSSIQQQGIASPSDIAPLGEANPTMKTKSVEAPAKLVPVAMRAGTHEGFDRVVIELTGEGTPGWHVDYTPLPTQQGSGQEMKVNGDTFLNVSIDGTTYPFELGLQANDLTPVAGEGPAVAEVISGGTFEGRSQFIVGLRGERRPYAVSFIEDPKRLVIDFNQN
ncbi:AMIN-like domain-containing (lipo)protein [Corynebacterium sp. H130]|uniref:AMIN-like domain-containing (lipo)protein n=1 Tax=Corynebacterium sp. H130 TaxID=3133444 RepID=UPI0030AB5376